MNAVVSGSIMAHADYLASYISDASTVEKLTSYEFGHAPARKVIEALIAKHRPAPRKAPWDCKTISRRSEEDDGLDYQVPGLVKGLKPKKKSHKKAEPVPELTEPLPIPPHSLPQERILYGVAADFKMLPSDIMGKDRRARYVEARAVVIRLLRDRDPVKWSYIRLGQFLGGRDHSSIINVANKWHIYAKRNPTVEASYERRHEG